MSCKVTLITEMKDMDTLALALDRLGIRHHMEDGPGAVEYAEHLDDYPDAVFRQGEERPGEDAVTGRDLIRYYGPDDLGPVVKSIETAYRLLVAEETMAAARRHAQHHGYEIQERREPDGSRVMRLVRGAAACLIFMLALMPAAWGATGEGRDMSDGQIMFWIIIGLLGLLILIRWWCAMGNIFEIRRLLKRLEERMNGGGQ